jgi:hypothetical protein
VLMMSLIALISLISSTTSLPNVPTVSVVGMVLVPLSCVYVLTAPAPATPLLSAPTAHALVTQLNVLETTVVTTLLPSGALSPASVSLLMLLALVLLSHALKARCAAPITPVALLPSVTPSNPTVARLHPLFSVTISNA